MLESVALKELITPGDFRNSLTAFLGMSGSGKAALMKYLILQAQKSREPIAPFVLTAFPEQWQPFLEERGLGGRAGSIDDKSVWADLWGSKPTNQWVVVEGDDTRREYDASMLREEKERRLVELIQNSHQLNGGLFVSITPYFPEAAPFRALIEQKPSTVFMLPPIHDDEALALLRGQGILAEYGVKHVLFGSMFSDGLILSRRQSNHSTAGYEEHLAVWDDVSQEERDLIFKHRVV